MEPGSGLKLSAFLLLQLSCFLLPAECQISSGDADVMFALKKGLNPPEELGWSGTDPCKWAHVGCSDDKRVTRIQIGGQNLSGTLFPGISNLTRMERLELQRNSISGPLPSLSGLSSLQVLLLGENKFTSIPADFFIGMSSLITVEMDGNPFSPWELPASLQNCSTLQNFSANSANITGEIPGFISPDGFPGLLNLHLAMNSLSGVLPSSFSGLQIETLWVNGNNLSEGIDVLQNMTYLKQVWLHHNAFSGQLPDFSNLNGLEEFSVRDNGFTGPVPSSLVNLESLKVVNLTNNFLQGSVPQFGGKVSVDMLPDSNRFCLPKPGACDPRVDTLLSIVRSVGYPRRFADIWKGNDPCDAWLGITCNSGNITIVNFEKMELTGTISPDFGSLKSLQRLILSNNNLTGTIPTELATLPVLSQLDVRNNSLYGHVPTFRGNMDLKTDGNPDLGKDKPSSPSSVTPKPGGSPGSPPGSDANSLNGHKKSRVVIVILSVLGGIFVVCLLGLVAFCLCKGRGKNSNRVQSPNAMIIHPRYSGSDDTESSVKITVAGSSVSVGAMSEAHHAATGETSDLQMVEAGNIKISIQVLRNVTNNFSEENILGRGGFGTVYKGALHDGTKIAVKRMESGVLAGKGLDEFRSEIAVLTKVRHRHLVALLGFCIDGNEKLLVYEYMPQGTLSRHLFGWANEGLRPLEWTKRLTIALDVARGVEYLHGLAQQSFIHRDLKPSNILLGDDMRAKVGDFGLVRLAPEGKASIETRLAGTFGYLAPEYAVTGRVSTKVDVFSFGVILMELITGRKALDETQPEESMHLVTWFRRVYLNKDMFRKAIDPTIDLTEEILASVNTVAELAGHCSAREPHQRPDMGHAVNVLSSLLDLWKPSVQSTDDIYGIDFEMSLPQALKKWQSEGRSNMDSSSSSYLPSLDNTQTSIPTRPYGFAESFTSTDGR